MNHSATVWEDAAHVSELVRKRTCNRTERTQTEPELNQLQRPNPAHAPLPLTPEESGVSQRREKHTAYIHSVIVRHVTDSTIVKHRQRVSVKVGVCLGGSAPSSPPGPLWGGPPRGPLSSYSSPLLPATEVLLQGDLGLLGGPRGTGDSVELTVSHTAMSEHTVHHTTRGDSPNRQPREQLCIEQHGVRQCDQGAALY